MNDGEYSNVTSHCFPIRDSNCRNTGPKQQSSRTQPPLPSISQIILVTTTLIVCRYTFIIRPLHLSVYLSGVDPVFRSRTPLSPTKPPQERKTARLGQITSIAGCISCPQPLTTPQSSVPSSVMRTPLHLCRLEVRRRRRRFQSVESDFSTSRSPHNLLALTTLSGSNQGMKASFGGSISRTLGWGSWVLAGRERSEQALACSGKGSSGLRLGVLGWERMRSRRTA